MPTDVMFSSMSLIGEAIVVWTGYGVTNRPKRDVERLVEHFGENLAVDLLPKVRALEEDFFASDAHLTAPDLSMGEEAASRFRQLHPDVPEEAVQALAWCYTFTYK